MGVTMRRTNEQIRGMRLLRIYLREKHFEIFTLYPGYRKDWREFLAVRTLPTNRKYDGVEAEIRGLQCDVLMCRFYFTLGISLTPLEKRAGFPLRPTERKEVEAWIPCRLYFREKAHEALNRNPASTGNHMWHDLTVPNERESFV